MFHELISDLVHIDINIMRPHGKHEQRSFRTLKKYSKVQDYTSIILEGNMDKFDEFVENWNKLGGEEITEEVNTWHAEQ